MLIVGRHAVENIGEDGRIFDRRKVDQIFEELIMQGLAIEIMTEAVTVADEEQLV